MGINVTWPWIEDYSPYPITSKYIDYSTLEGALPILPSF